MRFDVSAARMLAFAGALALGSAASSPASAQTPDYAGLFKLKVLKCLHPTVNADKATYEITKGPETKGETTTVRLKIFYDGIMKKNAMDADLMIRQAGTIRQLMVKVLSDTGSGMARCPMTTTWTDF